jgi:bacteriorhodopsin
MKIQMSELDDNSQKRKLKWPWFAAAAILLFIALAVFWVTMAAKKIEQQRDFTPLPSSAPTR